MKERICRKAIDFYRRYGVKSVTMDELASQLGISKKTIYQYYKDKSELVNEAIVKILEYNKGCALECSLEAENALHELFIAKRFLGEVVSNMNPVILYDIEKFYPGSFQKFTDFKYDFLYHKLVANLERGIKEGLYRKEVEIEIIAKMRLESLNLSFRPPLFPDNRFSMATINNELIMFYIYGLVTPRGLELINEYKKEYES